MSDKLSVIVPAYHAADTILDSVRSLEQELGSIGRPYEIIIVCDGCRPTYDVVKMLSSDSVKVYYYEHNLGKGYALKYGVMKSTGDLVTFIDADMAIDPSEIDIFIKLMEVYDCDVVIGSKRHPQSKVHYPAFRRFQSFVYQLMIAVLFNINVRDTQTGLKLFRRQVLEKVIPRVLVKEYAFDLELLAVAHHLGYGNVLEAPVVIKEQFSSTTNLRAAWRVLLDTLAIFYRLRILRYYDQEQVFQPAGPQRRVSVIIPVKKVNDYVRESSRYLAHLGYDNFEVIVFPDVVDESTGLPEDFRVIPTGEVGPAEKRDMSLTYATGEIIAFLDDDAYPRQDWLINAMRHFERQEVAAVVGPAVTPEGDPPIKVASGAVYESRLGGGSLRYRYVPRTYREVDDFASVNMLIRKEVFAEVGGFDTHYWPGEDTKLCMDVARLGRKIIYDPDVTVWHHRRPLFFPHLKQVAGYATHRGYFAKKLPYNSLRPVYFVPSIFVLALIGGLVPALSYQLIGIVYAVWVAVYAMLLLGAGLWAALMHDIRVGILTVPAIFLTHLVYGVFFIKGLLSRRLAR